MEDLRAYQPLRQLFAELVGRVFWNKPIELRDREVLLYLCDLLTRFTRMDRIYRLRDARGRRLEEVAEMLMEADVLLNARSFHQEREVHKHIGDFTLFWTGVYPEALRLLRHPTRKDHLIDYVQQGKRSYYIASTFEEGEWRKESRILRRLSHEFEICSFGLNLVRREWEKMGDPTYRLIMEAFEDWEG